MKIMSSVNNILFYSGHCPFCKEVMELIQKRDLKEYFVFVCVDQVRNRQLMPKQIDRVPALLIKSENRVIFEDAIIKFIGVPDSEDIMPLDNQIGGFSEGFSFLDDDSVTGNNTPATKNFALFGQEQRIQCPEEDDGGGKTDTSNVLDRYMSERAKDVTSIFGDKKIVP